MTSDDQARGWLAEYCAARKIPIAGLTPAQIFQLTSLVPCSIRCWRVGVAIPLSLGETCPECGKKYELTFWERLAGEDGIG